VRGAEGVFHFAAQVAVTSSLDDPQADLQVNLLGTANLLEAMRLHAPDAPLLFASTNKVYGGMGGIRLRAGRECYTPEDAAIAEAGFDETTPLEFHTPYGCSKGAADQYVLDYARSFGLRTAVMRMSCIYGPRQLGTEDQGWVAHFLMRALGRRPITIYGDGRQVRDVLHVADAVAAYVSAWRNIASVAGRAFNLGGGPENAVSLLQLVRHAGRVLGRPLELRFSPWRLNDQRYYVSDPRAARTALDLPPPRGWRAGVADLLTDLALRDRAPYDRADATALSA
jgi:CDP-paratose 2-epimerase